MKKLLLFLLAALGIVGFSGRDLYTFNSELSGEYVAYVEEGADTAVFSVVGEGVYSTSNYGIATNAGIIAETVTLPPSVETAYILKLLGSIYTFEDSTSDIQIIYGYSPMLKHLRIIKYRPVNFQITRTKDAVTVSSPVNLGSY